MDIPQSDVTFLHLHYIIRILIDGIQKKIIPRMKMKKAIIGKKDDSSVEITAIDENADGKKG